MALVIWTSLPANGTDTHRRRIDTMEGRGFGRFALAFGKPVFLRSAVRAVILGSHSRAERDSLQHYFHSRQAKVCPVGLLRG